MNSVTIEESHIDSIARVDNPDRDRESNGWGSLKTTKSWKEQSSIVSFSAEKL
jgi:hypothetical protein